MGALDLHDFDLNLLRVLRQLLRERSVSAAAASLGLTQPALSNALRRLRTRLDDPLFVRTPAGMEPTPYALAIAAPVEEALSLVGQALLRPRGFDATTSRRQMTLAMTDIGEIVFLPRLQQTLRERAPGLTLATCRPSAGRLREDMERGRVDLAVGHLPQLDAGFHQRGLFTQRHVCLLRRGHPLDPRGTRRSLTRAEFLAAEHVAVESAGTGNAQIEALLERAGVERNVRLTVPHFVAVGHIVSATDLVATVTEKFAERCAAPFGLRVLPHPVKLPEIAIQLRWHERAHRDPAQRWLRALMVELFAD
jgi:DNA-binding transcriptional LysR family regulator